MIPKRYNFNKLIRSIYRFLGFVISGYTLIDDSVIIHLKRKWRKVQCPGCGRRIYPTSKVYERKVRDLDLGPYTAYINFTEFKLRCKCGFEGYEKFDFIRPYSRYTIRFEDYVSILCEKMSLLDVSRVMEIDWKTAKEIDKLYIKSKIGSLDNTFPTKIGIDEIAYEKGHKYLTIVRELFLGKVIWIGLARKEDTLNQFFYELGKEKTRNIELAVVDMWDPYIASIKKNCPIADIVIDRFHLMKIINDAVDKIRKEEFAKADDKERKNMMHKRFLILARSKNLKPEQKDNLEYLMKRNRKLYKAYLLKEEIGDIFDEEDENVAYWRLIDWIENVKKSKIEHLFKCLKTIRKYFYGIYNYFRYKVTNAGSEGFNNKINVIKRRAYGFSDLESF
jgi:transposase